MAIDRCRPLSMINLRTRLPVRTLDTDHRLPNPRPSPLSQESSTLVAATITIRAFREADRAHLKELTVASFSGVSLDQCIEQRFGELNGSTWQERKASHIDADLAAPGGTALVAEDGGRVIGYITVTMDAAIRLGRIPNMAVDAAYRGDGLGARLIQAALGYMRDHGMRHAKIETLAANEVGQHLYPKMGFVEIARQVHYVREL